jgi:hypothetical protein
MVGNDRVRFCGQCEKNVYDLSAMTLREAEDFVQTALVEGDGACIRFFRRVDGTILTADCPEGVARKRRRLKVLGIAAGSAAALMACANASHNASDEAAAKVSIGGIGAVIDDDAGSRSEAVYK